MILMELIHVDESKREIKSAFMDIPDACVFLIGAFAYVFRCLRHLKWGLRGIELAFGDLVRLDACEEVDCLKAIECSLSNHFRLFDAVLLPCPYAEMPMI